MLPNNIVLPRRARRLMPSGWANVDTLQLSLACSESGSTHRYFAEGYPGQRWIGWPQTPRGCQCNNGCARPVDSLGCVRTGVRQWAISDRPYYVPAIINTERGARTLCNPIGDTLVESGPPTVIAAYFSGLDLARSHIVQPIIVPW